MFEKPQNNRLNHHKLPLNLTCQFVDENSSHTLPILLMPQKAYLLCIKVPPKRPFNTGRVYIGKAMQMDGVFMGYEVINNDGTIDAIFGSEITKYFKIIDVTNVTNAPIEMQAEPMECSLNK